MKFTKGYEVVREKTRKNAKFLRSCFNCDSYFKGVKDKEELCQNPNVLSYDMVVREGVIYCSHWKPVDHDKKPFIFESTKVVSKSKALFKAQNKDRMF